MSFKILFVTATAAEAEVLDKIRRHQDSSGEVTDWKIQRSCQLVAGVGSISTAWAMQKWISANEKPDLAINAGIAGSYKEEISIGDVVMPVTDCFADAGIEDGDNFLTLSEAGSGRAQMNFHSERD